MILHTIKGSLGMYLCKRVVYYLPQEVQYELAYGSRISSLVTNFFSQNNNQINF